MKRLTNIAPKLYPLLALLFFVLLWNVGVRFSQVPPWILPAPAAVGAALANGAEILWYHTQTTLLEALLGFTVSIVLALILAILLHYLTWLYRALYPIFIVSQTIPLIVLAVLLPLWFGWGILPKVLIIVLVCFFPMVINLFHGMQSVDADLLDLFRSMGASRLATFRIVIMPAALPSFFAGLRISATYSIMAAVIGEWLGAQRGLGYFMTLQQKSFAIDRVLAAVVVICVLSLLLVKAIDCLEYLLLPWNRKIYSRPLWQ
ncbi:MAG: ABC transporter permease [Syntrophomonadaceae bacterium]|jgi:ABC-type nitrate/sulfonate/bicarbonate transport system permease component